MSIRIDRGTAIRLIELLASGLSDVGKGLGAMAEALDSGEASPADVAAYLRAMAAELQDIADSV